MVLFYFKHLVICVCGILDPTLLAFGYTSALDPHRECHRPPRGPHRVRGLSQGYLPRLGGPDREHSGAGELRVAVLRGMWRRGPGEKWGNT